MTDQEKQKIEDILITLTDITGFDHSSTALEAFHTAESSINDLLDKTIKSKLEAVEG
jgi:hypothetical protein